MGAQAALAVEQSRYARAMGGARATIGVAKEYTRGFGRQTVHVLKPAMVAVRRALRELLNSGASLTEKLHEFLRNGPELTEDTAQPLLLNLADHVEGLGKLLAMRAPVVARYRDFVAYWSQELYDKLEAQRDDLEYIVETIALGFSPNFRRQIADSLHEAGLAPLDAANAADAEASKAR